MAHPGPWMLARELGRKRLLVNQKIRSDDL
jgi:hypothetical protein